MKRHAPILRGSVLSVVSMALMTLLGFFLMPFVVHRLGDRVYGYWALVGTVLGYYDILDLGISPGGLPGRPFSPRRHGRYGTREPDPWRP